MTITTRNLSTLTDTIVTKDRLDASFEVNVPSDRCPDLLVGLRDSGRALNIVADNKRAVFDTHGRGRVSVTCSVKEDSVSGFTSNGTPISEYVRLRGWTVIATHPAMGVLGDVHFCTDINEILAIVDLVDGVTLPTNADGNS